MSAIEHTFNGLLIKENLLNIDSETAVGLVRRYVISMSPIERRRVMGEVFHGLCVHCYSNDGDDCTCQADS